MRPRLPPLTRLRAQELRDRARDDALDLAGAASRRWLPSGAAQRRIEAQLERRRAAPRHRMLPLLEIFAELHPDAFFVQIGSHDGQQQDPLRDIVLRGGWRGIMVEPVPYVFERLQRHYGQLPGIVLENVAVGAQDGPVPFYHLADTPDAGRPGLPIWFDALGSLRREVLLAHQAFIPDLPDRLVTTTVPGLTFDSLCRRHDVRAIDVLHIDTEGYDWEILRQVDFARFRPKLIIYESLHLSASEQEECTRLLHSHGYETAGYGLDTWCLNPDALEGRERRLLLGAWRWIGSSEDRQGPLLATRALRGAARRVLGRAEPAPDQLEQWFGLSDAERRYLALGYDDTVPLPSGAAEVLSDENPRLRELRRRYAALRLPAVRHHMWTPERVAEHTDLRYFRGDNLYQWHYPQHPRAMALSLFVYMRYLQGRGGTPLLERLSEDGLFGSWTTEVDGYGRISRDLLDSVSEMLFLDRQLGVLGWEGLRVLDVGAGFGRLAHRMASAHASLADYCCVDAVPESTFLCEYYLSFRGCSPPARAVPLDEVEKLEPGSFDLACNIHSFSECTAAAIGWWAEQLARLEVPYLFVVPNEAEGMLSREIDGGYRDAIPLLEAAGYRAAHTEPVIEDPAVRELVGIHDRFHLFARAGAAREAGGAAAAAAPADKAGR